ncbi:hypothetical protein QVD17_20688 [Tagetes erecta]|uniref:F-box domain-containing protein n=1 Tax=Tagetes erecta TaxID=13708 RepID=A0AAD8KS50_TARER|nr:hypothetical protein QVD17_20688 [Tagetes erecta]
MKKTIAGVSSRHAVVSNDDLLIEIMLRLPVLPLQRFKAVCKRWLTLITNPNLNLRRTQTSILDPPSGIFLTKNRSYKYDFVAFDVTIPPNRSPLRTSYTLNFDRREVHILQSCNGLLFCRMFRPTTSDEFYVLNPFTNRFKLIPQCPCPIKSIRFRMAFDPSKSPHYKVVYAARRVGNVHHTSTIQLHIYSSETCKWSECAARFNAKSFENFYDGLYWNDGLHWLEGKRPGDLNYKLDVEDLHLRSRRIPRTSDAGDYYQKLFVSRGCLLLLGTENTYSLQMNIYEMRKWSLGWSLKYFVNLNDISRQFPKPSWDPKWSCSSVGCIVIKENENDSFIVVEINGNIVQYKMVSKMISKLYDFNSSDPDVRFLEFIASLACV